MKKFRAKIALILVLSLTLAVAIPALAAQTTKITGMYEAPAIEVVIPTAAQAVINPFGLPQQITADDGRSDLGAIGTTGDKTIVTRPLVGYNMSKYDLKISANVTAATEKGDFKFAAAKLNKEGVVNFEIKTNDYTLAAGDTKWFLGNTDRTKSLNQLDGAGVVGALDSWAQSASPATGTISITNAANLPTTAAECTIKAATSVTDPATNRVTMRPDKESIFFARLNGDVEKKPLDANGKALEWTTRDGMDVTVAWTIELDLP